MNVTPRHSKRRAAENSLPSPDKLLQKRVEPLHNIEPQKNILNWATSDAKPMPEEGVLRDFDLDPHFGPCCSLTRRERWDRAFLLGLHPPTEVSSLIDRIPNKESVLDVHLRSISTSGSFR
jgi:hypothetical protein